MVMKMGVVVLAHDRLLCIVSLVCREIHLAFNYLLVGFFPPCYTIASCSPDKADKTSFALAGVAKVVVTRL